MAELRLPEGYAFEKCLHAGPRSCVLAVLRESDRRQVVLKRYVDDATAGGESRSEREFAALRQMSGPGIVAALDWLRTEQPPVLVLEPVPGVSLDAWIESGLPEPQAFLELAIQLADALARVHDARLLHRDIAPHNVYVDPGSLQSCLIDFGLARPLGSAAVRREAFSYGKSEAGTLR
jgi:serine/threonine protein kinase